MSAPLLLVTVAIYLGVAIDNWYHGKPGWALMFGCYALANVGAIWQMSR